MDSRDLSWNIRMHVLEMVHRSRASHIGSAYSVADILAVLYSDVLKYDVNNPNWEYRDRLILSKGHAGVALYAILAEVGFYSKKELDTYYLDGSKLSGHISHIGVPGVEFSTGSLGHGVCVACGMALALKKKGNKAKVFAIVGDGETDEGSFWETVMFANHYRLNNFTVVVDHNGLQSLDKCENTIELLDLKKKFEAFGWNVLEINGHNHKEILNAFDTKFYNDKPKIIIANTIKGKGVSFMENQVLWHYRDPQGEFYENAKQELEAQKNEK